MWIFASKVDSSAHLHADNFAYICIKRTEWCLNPTCSTFLLCFTPLPSAPIDCLHIFCLSCFARHTIGDWHRPESELPACCKRVSHSERLCLFWCWSTLLLRAVMVANGLERFLGGYVNSGAGQIRHPSGQLLALLISCEWFFFFLNIRERKHNTTLWKIWSLSNWFTVISNFQNRPWMHSRVITLIGILRRAQSRTEITASWCEQRCTAFSGLKQPQDLSFKLPPSSPSVSTRRCAEAAVYPARRTCASLISCLRAFSHARAAWGMRHFQNAEFYKKRKEKEVSRVKRNGSVCVRGLYGHAAVRWSQLDLALEGLKMFVGGGSVLVQLPAFLCVYFLTLELGEAKIISLTYPPSFKVPSYTHFSRSLFLSWFPTSHK